MLLNLYVPETVEQRTVIIIELIKFSVFVMKVLEANIATIVKTVKELIQLVLKSSVQLCIILKNYTNFYPEENMMNMDIQLMRVDISPMILWSLVFLMKSVVGLIIRIILIGLSWWENSALENFTLLILMWLIIAKITSLNLFRSILVFSNF